MRFLASIAAVTLPAVALAQMPLGFETALDGGRLDVLAAKHGMAKQRADALSADLRQAGAEARDLASTTVNLRWKLQDIRRRARLLDTPPGRRNPNQDPFFDMDARRLRFDVEDLQRRTETLAWQVKQLERDAKPAPELVRPAQELVDASGGLRSDSEWLQDEARWARMELSRINRPIEAFAIERAASDSYRKADDIASDAASLARKVKP